MELNIDLIPKRKRSNFALVMGVIAIKTGVWTKEQSIPWNHIKSMEYKTNWFKIIDLNGISSKLILSDLEFKILVETRDAINSIAREKGIAVT